MGVSLDDLLAEFVKTAKLLRSTSSLGAGVTLGYNGNPNIVLPNRSIGEQFLYNAQAGTGYLQEMEDDTYKKWTKTADGGGGAWTDTGGSSESDGGLPIVKRPTMGISGGDTAHLSASVVYYQSVSVTACEYVISNGTAEGGTIILLSGELPPSATWNLFVILQAHLKEHEAAPVLRADDMVNVYGRYKTDYIEEGQSEVSWSEWSEFSLDATYIVPELSIISYGQCFNPNANSPTLYNSHYAVLKPNYEALYPYIPYISSCIAASVGCSIYGGADSDTNCGWSMKFPGIIPDTVVRFKGVMLTFVGWHDPTGITPFFAVGSQYGTRYYGNMHFPYNTLGYYPILFDIQVTVPDESTPIYLGLKRRDGESYTATISVNSLPQYLTIEA
jgi:hypothetical protein